MQTPGKDPIVNFHRVYKATDVDRVVLWSADKRQMWFPQLLRVPMPNKFGQEAVVYNGQVPLSEASTCQLLALGGEHGTKYRLGDIMSQASDVEVVRGARELNPNLTTWMVPDCIVINAPKIFNQCIVEPDPILAKLGWNTPILMEHVEKPKVEQPSQLMERGFDPSNECKHYVGWVNWKLSTTMIDEWEKFLDIQIRVCMYTSHLLEDMRIAVPIGKESIRKEPSCTKPSAEVSSKRDKWVKKD